MSVNRYDRKVCDQSWERQIAGLGAHEDAAQTLSPRADLDADNPQVDR